MSSNRREPGSNVDLATLPSSDHLTLLFKHGKSTTLLSVLPSQPFSEVKEILLAALQSRNLFTLPGSNIPLPDDASRFQLGVLKDRKDATKGWTPLVIKDQSSTTDNKAGKKKASSKNDVLGEGPAGAGLTDGSWLAYRIAAQLEEDNDDMMVDIDDSGWDVVLPSYEDEEIDT